MMEAKDSELFLQGMVVLKEFIKELISIIQVPSVTRTLTVESVHRPGAGKEQHARAGVRFQQQAASRAAGYGPG